MYDYTSHLFGYQSHFLRYSLPLRSAVVWSMFSPNTLVFGGNIDRRRLAVDKKLSMCYFPFKNNDVNGKAYRAGVKEFNCGACPECLSQRARLWALRCSAQAEVQPAIMVTLTYDEYIRDTQTNRIIGERVGSTQVYKKDAQNFLKRLREHFARVHDVHDIKYMLTAEYGKRTHRAHYHAILFGVVFDDLVPYKRSKRGNLIYKSATLEKLWKHGICTVDSINVNGKVARYCTKYCAKDTRADDTFMLFSRGIGAKWLLDNFNGISYILDGREYSIPRAVWRDYIERKYDIKDYSCYVAPTQTENKLKKIVDKNVEKCAILQENAVKYREKLLKRRAFVDNITPKRKPHEKWSQRTLDIIDYYENELIPGVARKYVAAIKTIDFLSRQNLSIEKQLSRLVGSYGFVSYYRSKRKRDYYAFLRDNDTVYKRYLQYWQAKNELYEFFRPSVRERILQLPNEIYFDYKNAALKCLNHRERFKFNQLYSEGYIPPRSNCVARYGRYLHWCLPSSLPRPSCHYAADDRQRKTKALETVTRRLKFVGYVDWNILPLVGEQLSLFD